MIKTHSEVVRELIEELAMEFAEAEYKFHRGGKFGNYIADITYKMENDEYLVAEVGTFPYNRLTSFLLDISIGEIRWYNKYPTLIGRWVKPLDYFNDKNIQ